MVPVLHDLQRGRAVTQHQHASVVCVIIAAARHVAAAEFIRLASHLSCMR